MKMKKDRRTFLQASIAASAALLSGCGQSESETRSDAAVETVSRALKILVLGGTGFIGPHMVHEALRRGHEVTLFNRGKSNRALFPDLELLIGDRDNA
ncbi:MAG: NAD-dependent epimerase/dehydratase family protein, partial [Gammaproteobacteria bacterium]|nr:NAD-dependent epimerase/dehydratase family protein [Gammaproteobacteria bacterium]